MKLSKKSWVFISIGLFLIGLVGLWTAYSQQSGLEKQLKEELTLVNSKLNSIQLEQLANKPGELEQQLDKTLAQSETARQTLSQPMNSIIISDILFSTAEANSVNITAISSSAANRVTLEGVPCLALPVTASVEGELNQLVDFVTELNGGYPNTEVNTFNVQIPYPADNTTLSASIQMVIYAYEGS